MFIDKYKQTFCYLVFPALVNSPQVSGFAEAGWWEGEELTEGAGGGAIFTPPGGGGKIPPDAGRTLGFPDASLPSFF